MENIWWLYLLVLMPSIASAACVIFWLCVIGGSIALIVRAITEGDVEPNYDLWLKRTLIAAFSALIIVVITPGKEDLMFIVGGNTVIEAAKTDTAKKLAGKSVSVVEKWLDEQLSEKKGSK